MLAHIFALVVANYIKFVLFYVAVGVGYTFLKWVLMVYKLRRWIVAKKGYDSARKLANGEVDVLSWKTSLSNSLFGGYGEYPPKAKDNLGNLSVWGFFWPINLPYTLFADVIKELFNWLYELLGEVYNAIARAILPE